VNIFYEDGQVTEDRVLSLGNAITELANAGTASADFLVSFAKRMAGVSSVSNASLPAIMGIGAAFQEPGLREQVAATASTKMLFVLGQDIPKYARVAGKSVTEFTDERNQMPVEALIDTMRGLAQGKGSVSEISQALQAAGINATRVVNAMSTMGAK